jgi:hypothetical protein
MNTFQLRLSHVTADIEACLIRSQATAFYHYAWMMERVDQWREMNRAEDPESSRETIMQGREEGPRGDQPALCDEQPSGICENHPVCLLNPLLLNIRLDCLELD